MKKQLFILGLAVSVLIPFQSIAQDTAAVSQSQIDILAERNPTVDYTKLNLLNTAEVPEYKTKETPLKLTGIIYENDGVTPAKDVILFIEQADENGDFDIRKSGDKRYLHHKTMVKTDANGRYNIFTFVPGNDRRYNQLQQLFPVIKADGEQAYELESFLFDSDPLLTRMCRKKIKKKGDPSRILTLKKEGNMFVAEKNIVLQQIQRQSSI